uniref:Uncharacterized protein n=1 Tax=Arundo donax TaxID=35708 RepID=A0A0A9D523_ARUDO
MSFFQCVPCTSCHSGTLSSSSPANSKRNIRIGVIRRVRKCFVAYHSPLVFDCPWLSLSTDAPPTPTSVVVVSWFG